MGAVERLLLDEYLKSFQRNGLDLPAAERARFLELRRRQVELQTRFSSRLTEWDATLAVTRAELTGMEEAFINSLGRTAEGFYVLTLSYPHYFGIMENSPNADLRRRLQRLFYQRGGEENRALLQEAIAIRHELATLLGYDTHASFRTADRMAANTANVMAFLERLKAGLRTKGQENLADLVALKREELADPEVSVIHDWDWRYYENQLRKARFQVDQEQIKEYFPLDRVLAGMFELYELLFAVEFVETPEAPVWHESVRAFAVVDPSTGATLSYFYMDLFPRLGKYGHAAAFTLRKGRDLADGTYQKPISSIVANFNAPTAQAPSLLLHNQVETLFHEFGHIMHQILTTAKYSSLSGTSVKRDFVEAPSQIFENWVWEKPVLARISGHYLTGEVLPDELLEKMIAAKGLNQGIRYLRQVFFALLDMHYHTRAEVDTTQVYADLMREVMMIELPAETYPEASFSHLMGGYDAGYYGYLWSEVFAADMYTRFEAEGLYNERTGGDYRRHILEPGGTEDPLLLITRFLGREPSEEAFLRSLGIDQARAR